MNCTSLQTFPLPKSCLFGDCVNNTCICYPGFSSFQEIIDFENIYCSSHIYLGITTNIINIILEIVLFYQMIFKILTVMKKRNTNI